MKKFNLSIVAVLAMSTFAIAGGDIRPVEPVVETPVVEEAPAPVANDSGIYFGLGFTDVTSEFSGNFVYEGEGTEITPFDTEIGTSMTTFVAGYQINKYFAVEGRYMPQYIDLDIGIDGDSGEIEMSMDNIALYAKGMYPIGDFTVYGLLGYGQTSAELEIDGESIDELDRSDSGFQWGIGASYALSENTSLFIDYTQLYDDDDFDGIVAEINANMDPGESLQNTDFSMYAITFGMTYRF